MADNARMEVSLLQGRVKKALLRQPVIAGQGVLPRASVIMAMPIRSRTNDPWIKRYREGCLTGLKQGEEVIVLLKIQIESGNGSAQVAAKMEHRSL